ncbi:ABC-2 type transport system ATP-binding protein [Geomicrobium halophilum]|uniref:ABC-2 type transport system ATP-binding protein n=1 Tax=Geomicrobium halophilum TaxID=549000 RepID=A0A841PU58_9BACL|nr:ABC transporter ATP-binding protein [Geomicrobium halophilum]MBB6450686.1 ABC-2 type transport system ATP-binding protein [Geomicrobium halophilum]
MIQVQNVSKTMGRQTVLKEITFNVGKGTITGVVGRNGAGKTTLLRTMVSIVDPDQGTVMVNHRDIFKDPGSKQSVIYVSDSVEALKNHSVSHIVSLYTDIYPNFDRQYFQELMDRFQIPTVKKVKQYSKGRKALFALILAFAAKPEYVLLDEPTDGLDIIVKKEMMRFMLDEVAKEDVSIIIATHRLDELETLADQILVIKDGNITETFQLTDLREKYKKWQVVYREQMPESFMKNVYILQQSGRVYTCLAEGDVTTLNAELEESAPLLYDELPLSLEDLFIAKLGGESIAE